MFVGEVEIRPQSVQPLRAREGPKRESISSRLAGATVVDGLIGREQGYAAEQAQRGVKQIGDVCGPFLSSLSETFV
jgi:hypothetical protein